MGKEMRCNETFGGRFDTPQCKRMTVKTASGVPYCGANHEFETKEEMWERLYRETLYQSKQYEKLLSAKTEEIVALRKQVLALTQTD